MTETENLIESAQRGDELAFEKLINDNSALIWSIARRFIGRGCDADDLYQLGCLGLLKAIRGFDISLGNQFSTYAVPKILGEIRRFLRDDGAIKVSRTLKEKAAKIRFISEELQMNFGRDPTLSEISNVSGYSIEEIAEAEAATSFTDSLNREINEDGQTLGEILGTSGIEDSTLEQISVRDAINTLSERESTIIKLRFFRCLTQTQTAKIMNISQVQVSRIERSALLNLKSKL